MEGTYPKALEQFFMKGHPVRYTKGEIILRGDELVKDVYFIGKGYVKTYSINDSGDEYTHVIYHHGDIFPLIQVFNAQAPRRIFYEAMDSNVLWKMPKDKFLDYIQEQSNPVVYALLEKLSEQFNIFADRLDNLEYKTAYERVVYRILFLAGRFGKPGPEGLLIDAPITHKTIASSINLSRESVSREMERLGSQGLIISKKGRILIKDIDKLAGSFSEPVSADLWGLKT